MSILSILIIILSTILLSYWLVGQLIDKLKQLEIVDTPNHRTSHKGNVPRGGGLVIVVILLLCQLILAIISERYWVMGGLAGVVMIWSCLSGWDDWQSLSPRFRFIFQLLFTTMILLAFGYVTEIQISSNQFIYLSIAGVFLTFIGVIWMVNLYNFMDGVDGLAASQTIIAAITLAFWFWQSGDLQLAIMCVVLAAASYGFLLWNWHPAKIFMGDVGSITIGALFATLIIFANTRYQIPVISLVLLFGVFVYDASLTILRRLYRREKIWLPHRSHYYQRLVAAGVGHHHVVMMQSIVMMFCSLIASMTVLNHDRIVPGILLELVLLLICVIAVVIFERNQSHKN